MQLSSATVVAGTEQVLIDQTLNGRSDSFGKLVEPHLRALNRMARVRLQSDTEAEDAVQQTMLRAFCHLSQFRREASFKTWLCAIAFHEVSQVRRARGGVQFSPLVETQSVIPDPGVSPEAACQRRQELERLSRALTKLPEKYRRIIQLRDLRELSIAETAQSLSLSTPTVKIRHHRARKLLVANVKKLAVRRPACLETPRLDGV